MTLRATLAKVRTLTNPAPPGVLGAPPVAEPGPGAMVVSGRTLIPKPGDVFEPVSLNVYFYRRAPRERFVVASDASGRFSVRLPAGAGEYDILSSPGDPDAGGFICSAATLPITESRTFDVIVSPRCPARGPTPAGPPPPPPVGPRAPLPPSALRPVILQPPAAAPLAPPPRPEPPVVRNTCSALGGECETSPAGQAWCPGILADGGTYAAGATDCPDCCVCPPGTDRAWVGAENRARCLPKGGGGPGPGPGPAPIQRAQLPLPSVLRPVVFGRPPSPVPRPQRCGDRGSFCIRDPWDDIRCKMLRGARVRTAECLCCVPRWR